jgi:hypothetical protein
MKINALFDFFKTLLLAVIFCGGLIYADGHMLLTLQRSVNSIFIHQRGGKQNAPLAIYSNFVIAELRLGLKNC